MCNVNKTKLYFVENYNFESRIYSLTIHPLTDSNIGSLRRILKYPTARIKYIYYINREYRYILIWFRRSDIPTKFLSPNSMYFIISYGICKKRKYYFSIFLSTLLNTKHKKTHKKSSEKEFRYLAFYRTSAIIFTMLAWWFLLFA